VLIQIGEIIMSGIKAALDRELVKLARQKDNRDATIAVIEVLGESVKETNKLARQEEAIKDTEANIKKLKAAVEALSKKK
jgi:uncharacterized protein with HEPN domain